MQNSEHKIFNFESQINVEETIKKFGYHPDKYGKTSSKKVVATCRICGNFADISKGNWNKRGYACHNECRINSLKTNNNLTDPVNREKAKKAMIEKYGTDKPSLSKEIANKISKSRSSQTSRDKYKSTSMERYGVDNIFKSEQFKADIKKKTIDKYGVEHISQAPEIQNKKKNTSIEKYGTDYPVQSDLVKEKIKSTIQNKYGVDAATLIPSAKSKALISFNKTVSKDQDGSFLQINTLRNNQEFWDDMEKGLSVQDLCSQYGLKKSSLSSMLLSDEFKDKYYKLYSFPRQQVQNEIYSYFAKYNLNIIYNDRSVIGPYELDIYFPDKNLAIEFNGSYWHSEMFLDESISKNKHYDKSILAKSKGIHIVHIFEHTWIHRKEQYINLLKSYLGLNEERIHARKCNITHGDSGVFLDKHHLQGSGTRVLKTFNLNFNKEIVATITASLHHRNGPHKDTVILNRLCFKSNVNIAGGASRLFSALKQWAKGAGYKKIISWSDNSWASGNVYEILGFERSIDYGPDYFYYDSKNKKYKSKQSCMKSKIGCPAEVKEKDFCRTLGLYRIWDCGKTKWEYIL